MGADEFATIPHYIALAFPPEKTYSFIDKAIAGINTFVGLRGYAVVKGRTNNDSM
jgi:hypothetical protein